MREPYGKSRRGLPVSGLRGVAGVKGRVTPGVKGSRGFPYGEPPSVNLTLDPGLAAPGPRPRGFGPRQFTCARPLPGGKIVAPWPDALPTGPRTVHPFTPCAECGTGTWVHYGPVPLCLRCARWQAMRPNA